MLLPAGLVRGYIAVLRHNHNLHKPNGQGRFIQKMNNNIIECTDVSIFYGQTKAIKNVNLSFPERSVTAFIGPSGCGKSTFLRSLNRMNDLIPQSRVTGEILLEKENIYSDGIKVDQIRKKVGMVFQKPNPFYKSIYDNIAFAPKYYGKKKKELDEIVESSLRKSSLWEEVKDRLHKSAYDLSGGQQQRLCIARAIALKPDVLLLDEPTASLDPLSTQKIENLVVDLKKEYTLIIVTHNLHQAARISDSTAFFYMGNLIEHRETKKMFTKPSQKKTEDYITGRFG